MILNQAFFLVVDLIGPRTICSSAGLPSCNVYAVIEYVLNSFATMSYQFTNTWFAPWHPIWSSILNDLKPSRYLEIGSFEGQSLVYVMKAISAMHASCTCVAIDPFLDINHIYESKDPQLESTCRNNIHTCLSEIGMQCNMQVNLIVDKSSVALASLIASASEPFDLIYVDGSHRAPDVLSDACMAFHLLRVGGIIIFDDYLTAIKPSVDAFANIFNHVIKIIQVPANGQVYCLKTGDLSSLQRD